MSKSLQFRDSEPWIKCRYIVVLFGFASDFFLYSQRIVVGITIVFMVSNSALTIEEKNKTQSCPNLMEKASDEAKCLNEDYGKKDGKFDWSPKLQGYILASSFLCFTLATAPAGKLIELFGGKNVLFWGFLVSSVFTFVSPFAAWLNVYALIIVQGLRGLFQAGFVPALSALIANWCPKSERGFSYTLILSGSCWGAIIGSYLSGYLCETSLIGGWPLPYFIFGGAGIITSLLMGFFMFDNPSIHPKISKSEFNYIISNQETILTQRRPKTPWSSIFSSVPVYALTYAYFGQMWAITYFLSEQPTYIDTILHYSIERNGLFTGLPFVLQFVTSVGGGWISDLFNKKKYMSVNTARKFWNCLSCFGYSACLFGVYFAGCNRSLNISFAIASLAVLGFANAGCWVTSTDMSPTFAASVNAVSCTIGFSSNFILPLVVGYMTNEMQTIEQWNKIILISIGIVSSSGIVFAVFGSARVQPWNDVQENDAEKNKEKATRF